MGETMSQTLPEVTKDEVLEYCDKYLADEGWFEREFDFISKPSLVERLALEFYAARYLYKLGQGLAVSDKKLHAHTKFQIMQYASIYEAIIDYLLKEKYADHKAVIKIRHRKAYKPLSKLPKDIRMLGTPDDSLSICAYRYEKIEGHSIKFGDKIDAAVEIGFLDKDMGAEIAEFFRLRNGIHLDNAVAKQIKYEIEQARLAYRRMRPFIGGVKQFLSSTKKKGAV
jgi:hypothetical protein